MKPSYLILIAGLLICLMVVGGVGALDPQISYNSMTSNATNQYTANRSGIATISTEAWVAFDGANVNSGWQSSGLVGPRPEWVGQYIGTQKNITSYTIYPYSAQTYTPKTWTIEGSNIGFTGWTVLDSRSNVTPWTYLTGQNFPVTGSKAYSYYRLNITEMWGGPQTVVNELYLYGLSTPVSSFTANVTSGIAPLSVLFTDTSTNAPTSGQYNATNVTGNNVPFTILNTLSGAYTFQTAGNYSVKLNATNSAGSNISAQITYINVSSGATKPIAMSSLSRLAIQAGSYTWFNDTSLNTPTAYCWTFWDGTFAATANGSKTYYRRGIFNVSSNVTNSAGFNLSYNIIRVV
jgi:PKD repeat protein